MSENTEVIEFEKLTIHHPKDGNIDFTYDEIIEIDPDEKYVFAVKDEKFVQYHRIPFTVVVGKWNDDLKARLKKQMADESA